MMGRFCLCFRSRVSKPLPTVLDMLTAGVLTNSPGRIVPHLDFHRRKVGLLMNIGTKIVLMLPLVLNSIAIIMSFSINELKSCKWSRHHINFLSSPSKYAGTEGYMVTKMGTVRHPGLKSHIKKELWFYSAKRIPFQSPLVFVPCTNSLTHTTSRADLSLIRRGLIDRGATKIFPCSFGKICFREKNIVVLKSYIFNIALILVALQLE
ncbi:hypothetical protein BX666DRAFT_1490751 [Dichotomocladium elegans]|nr:hypothetical protein BX666DRAFT_1490751 [Dichotomocladium elegans]